MRAWKGQLSSRSAQGCLARASRAASRLAIHFRMHMHAQKRMVAHKRMIAQKRMLAQCASRGLGRAVDNIIDRAGRAHCVVSQLELSGCPSLTDVLVCEVVTVRFTLLRRLLLAQCLRLTEAAFCTIGERLPDLRELDLSSCAVTDAAISCVAGGCRHLEKVTLRSCRKLTDTGIATLGGLPELLELDLSSNRELTDGALGAIAAGCKRLRVMHVALCPKVAGEAVRSHWARQLPELSTLNLSASALTDASATAIAEASAGRHRLSWLNISRTYCGDGGVAALVRAAPALSGILVAGCLNLSEATMYEVSRPRTVGTSLTRPPPPAPPRHSVERRSHSS